VARYAVAAARLGRFAAAALDDAAAAVGYWSALAFVAGLPTVVAAARVDAGATARAWGDLTAVLATVAVYAATATAAIAGRLAFELVTWGRHLRCSRTGNRKPGDQNARGTSQT
jgi:hypothetical protein